ncbi:lysine transporter LysE [Arcobacter sp. 31_11_sub10_T18]|nr:lysine transporter LysE [Arcobacter sp. 31_11_sub10_T18]
MSIELYLSGFITLAFAHFVALLSPGVDFFIIISNSSKYGKLSGIISSFGIASANLVYILLALFGIGLIRDNIILFTAIKVIGAIYLLYIGYLLLRASKRDLFHTIENNELLKMSKKLILKHFGVGFLSALLNPKNSIFYFTMFSISVQNDTPFEIQSFYALWMFSAVLVWDIFIVYLVTNKKSKKFMQKYSNKIEKISGGILIVLASSIMISTLGN